MANVMDMTRGSRVRFNPAFMYGGDSASPYEGTVLRVDYAADIHPVLVRWDDGDEGWEDPAKMEVV